MDKIKIEYMKDENINQILEELETILWQYESDNNTIPKYTMEAFRAGVKIFMSVMMNKVWALQESEEIEFSDRKIMIEKLGEDIRKMVKTYTDIDTLNLHT